MKILNLFIFQIFFFATLIEYKLQTKSVKQALKLSSHYLTKSQKRKPIDVILCHLNENTDWQTSNANCWVSTRKVLFTIFFLHNKPSLPVCQNVAKKDVKCCRYVAATWWGQKWPDIMSPTSQSPSPPAQHVALITIHISEIMSDLL